MKVVALLRNILPREGVKLLNPRGIVVEMTLNKFQVTFSCKQIMLKPFELRYAINIIFHPHAYLRLPQADEIW